MKDYQKHILSHYSAFAAMFLFCKTGQAEAIYTDIDPDILLSLDNDVYNIDINNDGLLDFKLQKSVVHFIHIGANICPTLIMSPFHPGKVVIEWLV